MKSVTVGHASCAIGVASGHYPVQMIRADYHGEPIPGAIELVFKDENVLKVFCGQMEAMHIAPWKVSFD